MSRIDCMRVRMSSVSTLVTTSPVLVAGALYSIGSLIFISFHCLGSVYFLSHVVYKLLNKGHRVAHS